MAYLEELLPEFRKGAKIRLAHWNKGKFIALQNSIIVDNANYEYPLSIPETLSNQWELYQEPIDWYYIIKNKCLCYFSNNDYSANYFGYLKGREEDDNWFIDNKLNKWKNCRPVRRDEVTFYEDKKDE